MRRIFEIVTIHEIVAIKKIPVHEKLPIAYEEKLYNPGYITGKTCLCIQLADHLSNYNEKQVLVQIDGGNQVFRRQPIAIYR